MDSVNHKPKEGGKPVRRHTNSGQYSPSLKKDAERLRFIEWLSLPSSARNPKTQRELAKQLGVDAATLSDWKRSPDLWEKVRRWVDERVKEDHADVMSALVDTAKQGNVQAQKLYLEYIQNWSEGMRHEIRNTERVVFDFSKLDAKQLAELAALFAEDSPGGSME
jgi:Helix-turn-helix of insertion element transposase